MSKSSLCLSVWLRDRGMQVAKMQVWLQGQSPKQAFLVGGCGGGVQRGGTPRSGVLEECGWNLLMWRVRTKRCTCCSHTTAARLLKAPPLRLLLVWSFLAPKLEVGPALHDNAPAQAATSPNHYSLISLFV